MKMMRLKCPHCDADLETKDGLDTFYCTYCGGKIMIEGMSKQAYKAKVSFKQMEHEEIIKDKEYEHEKFKIVQNEKEYIRSMLILILIPLIIFGGMVFSHKAKIYNLQKIEDQIYEEISVGNYDHALFLANQLHCDDNYSKDESEVWDTKRENYIDMILQKKREADANNENVEYICVPDSSEKLIGKKYSDVAEKFRQAGFTNVTTKETSKEKGIFNWKDTVEHITISGKENFSAEDTFEKKFISSNILLRKKIIIYFSMFYFHAVSG